VERTTTIVRDVMTEELGLFRKAPQLPSTTMRDVLAVMFRQRILVMLSFAVSFLSAILYGYFLPSYQSEMKVLVRKGRVDPLITPAPTPSPQFERTQISEEDLNSEVVLLHDQDVLRTVVNASGLADESDWMSRILRHNIKQVRIEHAVRRLARQLKADPVRKTNLIQVSYASADGARAERVLQNLAAAYLAKHLELRRPSGESQFFDRQAVDSKQSLDTAELRLVDFMRSRGVVSASLERDLALQKLSATDFNRLQTQVVIAEHAARVRALDAKLTSIPARRTTQIRTSDNPLLLEKMKSKLLELELKHTELLTKFKPSYRLVAEVDQQIADTRAAIATEGLSPVQDQTTERDPDHDWAQAELLKAQVELSALHAKASAAAAQLDNSRTEAQRLATDAIKQDELLRDLKAAEEKYLLYAGKREESRIGDALDQGGILNVVIAEQPTLPALPSRSQWSFAFLGFLFAGAFSTALAFTIDFLDPAFRTADEVVAYLGSPVLASLPRRTAVGGNSR
jgi:uncharacterized protein involved in exopolysaccharide biosynthesis